MSLLKQLPMILGFFISLGLLGFAAVVYNNDHTTALTIVALVGGHWLGVGSVATGKTLSDLATQTTTDTATQIVQTASQIANNKGTGS